MAFAPIGKGLDAARAPLQTSRVQRIVNSFIEMRNPGPGGPKSDTADIPGLEAVAQAGDVCTALANLRGLRPNAMLLDLVLPDGSGFEVLEGIVRERLDCAAIVVTNLFEPQARQRCMDLGASHFFDKSANVMDVIEVVRNMTEARSRKIETNDESRRPFEELESKQ